MSRNIAQRWDVSTTSRVPQAAVHQVTATAQELDLPSRQDWMEDDSALLGMVVRYTPSFTTDDRHSLSPSECALQRGPSVQGVFLGRAFCLESL